MLCLKISAKFRSGKLTVLGNLIQFGWDIQTFSTQLVTEVLKVPNDLPDIGNLVIPGRYASSCQIGRGRDEGGRERGSNKRRTLRPKIYRLAAHLVAFA